MEYIIIKVLLLKNKKEVQIIMKKILLGLAILPLPIFPLVAISSCQPQETINQKLTIKEQLDNQIYNIEW